MKEKNKYGAVIVAAGMSSRMGDFKPLLKVGNLTIIERVVSTMKSSGIEQIVIITGNNAKALEDYLKNQGIIFIRNEHYAQSQMFDSAKIGFKYLMDKCDKIVFTPADMPLYTSSTVKELMKSKAKVAYPVIKQRKGHPIMLDVTIVPSILSYNGDEGLKGALKHIDEKEYIVVEDEGIFFDADTKDDYQKLLKIHNSQLHRIELDISLVKENTYFNSEVAHLLTMIDHTGSIRDACSKMNMSYSKGLKIINNLEKQLSNKVVLRKTGGVHGGYTCLSSYGKVLLKTYHEFGIELNKLANDLFTKNFEDIIK